MPQPGQAAARAALLEAIVESAPTALIVADRRGRMIFANRAALALFGYQRAELLGQTVDLLLPEPLQAGHLARREAFFARPEARPMGAGRTLSGRRRDGSELPIEIALTPLAGPDGPLVLAVVLDISGRRRLERRFELAVEAAPIAMLMLDAEGRIVLCNRECERLFGHSRGSLRGQPVELLLPARFHAGPRRRAAFFSTPVPRRLGRRRPLAGLHRDGHEIPIEIGLNPVPADDGPLYLAVIVDLTEHQRLADLASQAQEALERRVRERTLQLEQADRERAALLADLQAQRAQLELLSREDALTGLANRREFDRRLEAEILHARRSGTPLALALFDLDHFKRVNDRHGHPVGDSVLRQAAELIRSHCRATDLVARYGGEEFGLALPGSTEAAAASLCERIRAAFEAHAWHAIRPSLALTISAGVAALAPGQDGAALLAAADARLYQAKHAGRNRVLPGAD